MSERESGSDEGLIAVPGGRVWYRRVGSGAATPLLVLHGGPGFPHDYLEPLAALAAERPVIFYDQLGCGRSERPDAASLWRIDRFVEELACVRQALGLTRVHLLGHSWGTILACEYLGTRPAGIDRLILASPCLSLPRWRDDLARERALLPVDVQVVLSRHEAAGTTAAPAYQAATFEFYRRHLCRLSPWPAPLLRSLQGAGDAVYEAMWGVNEFFVTGSLSTYDGTALLTTIERPVLLTCGRYDEATPETTAWYAALLPHAELAVFEQSAHMPHLEQMQPYLERLRAFLSLAD